MIYLLKLKQCHKIRITSPTTIADIALLRALLKYPVFITLREELDFAIPIYTGAKHHPDLSGPHWSRFVKNSAIFKPSGHKHIQVQSVLSIVVDIAENGVCPSGQ